MTAPDWRPDQVHASNPRAARRRRHREEPVPPDTRLHIESLNRLINEYAALNNPELMMLIGEDCAWQAARDDWKQRRPAPWHRAARRAWRAEGRALADKSQRLRELGTELGLAPRAPARRNRLGRAGR